MKFSYAIFDMDGLMFDTENLFVRAFEEAIGPGNRLPVFAGKDEAAHRAQPSGGAGNLPTAVSGCPAPCEACLTRFRAWMQEYIRENGIPVKPGLRTLLAWLKEQGVSCAVATSTDTKVAKSYLENAGITAYFQTISGGDQVTRSKPDPEIFHLGHARARAKRARKGRRVRGLAQRASCRRAGRLFGDCRAGSAGPDTGISGALLREMRKTRRGDCRHSEFLSFSFCRRPRIVGACVLYADGLE